MTGVSARNARRGLRVPPTVMRLGVRQLGSRCLNPALPWQVQRPRLGQLAKTTRLPRGTDVTASTIGGVPAEVVSAGARDSAATVVHFHGGGYCVGSAGTVRSWAAHLTAAVRCQILLPPYPPAPAPPFP